MKSLNNKKIILLCVPILLCIFMIIIIPFLTNIIGTTTGYIIGFCIYWFVFCVPASYYFSNGSGGIKGIYSQMTRLATKNKIIYYILAFVPCFGVLFAVFIEIASKAGFQVLLLALVFALINGTIEEMFWRGLFNKIFTDNIFLAFLFPSLFFGIWHISLFLAKEIEYQGGFVSLVGGAYIVGLLWGGIAYKTKSIKVVTIAHIITNFMAFTGLIYQNWFMK